MLGEKLKEARLSQELTMVELAERLKTSKQVINNYEKGFRFPKKESLIKILNAIGLTKEEFNSHCVDVMYVTEDNIILVEIANRLPVHAKKELKEKAEALAKKYEIAF